MVAIVRNSDVSDADYALAQKFLQYLNEQIAKSEFSWWLIVSAVVTRNGIETVARDGYKESYTFHKAQIYTKKVDYAKEHGTDNYVWV